MTTTKQATRPTAAYTDTQRAEWMAVQRARVVSASHRGDWPPADEEVHVEWRRCGDDVCFVVRRPNWRTAVDAAMAGECDNADPDHECEGMVAPPPAPEPPDARLAEIRAALPGVQRQYVGNPAWLAIHTRYVEDVTALLARVEADARTIAALRGEVEEMRAALRKLGITRSDEHGDDGSEWVVTLEPQGPEPVSSLEMGLVKLCKAFYSDGWNDGDADAAMRAGAGT